MDAVEVTDRVASLMNDTAKSVYTFAAVLPYLNTSLDVLQELFEQNNIPSTNETSALINVPANTSVISFGGSPALPTDLIEIQALWVSSEGLAEYTGPIRRVEFLPRYMEGVDYNSIDQWAWIDQEIRFFPANADLDIKLDYIKSIFVPIVLSTDLINILNVKSYLSFKTAAYCARYIGENPTRADQLDAEAELALDRSLGISTKGKQSIRTRRRPFMAAFKTRGMW